MSSRTIHHKCKVEVLQREKDYGRPSLVSRPSRRSASSTDIPVGLPDVLINTPDLIHELALGHTRAQKAAKSHNQESKGPSRLGSPWDSKSKSMRPSSAPVYFRDKTTRDKPFPRDSLEIMEDQKLRQSEKQRAFVSSPSVGAPPKVPTTVEEDRHVQLMKPGSSPWERSKQKERQRKSFQMKRRRSSFVQKYTLDTFLSEVEARQKEVKDIDFSGKDHALWHMGMTQGAMKSGFSEDVKYYQNKFQRWARGVLDRERNLLGFNVYDDNQESPSLTKGAPREEIVRLEQGSGPQSKNRKTRKRGLLKKSRRAVSIVSICPVEVLVLNMWDFHRHCDRDIIAALAENDYRKEEQIYKQYLKNCRWEQFKKKCLDDIVDNMNYQRCLRFGPRGMRFIPKSDTINPSASPTEWK